MSFLQRLFYNLWYAARRPPWDSGITPPELWQFIRDNPPGRAIDLGCGTGTNAITLSQNGWHVTGVDFAKLAIERARQKSRQQNAKVTFLTDDVTRLPEAIGPFDLVLDIGCFHGLPATLRPVYLKTIHRILVLGGTWLLYAMHKIESSAGLGIAEQDLSQFEELFSLRKRQVGLDPNGRRASWFWLSPRS